VAWNQNHVEENYDPALLNELKRLVSAVRKVREGRYSMDRQYAQMAIF
jgi:hypothetical protein